MRNGSCNARTRWALMEKLAFHLLKNSVYFPLLVLMEVYHYWKYLFLFFPAGLSK